MFMNFLILLNFLLTLSQVTTLGFILLEDDQTIRWIVHIHRIETVPEKSSNFCKGCLQTSLKWLTVAIPLLKTSQKQETRGRQDRDKRKTSERQERDKS